MAADSNYKARGRSAPGPALRNATKGRPGPGDVLDSGALLHNPQFQQLVRERTSFAWTLSAAMLVVYLAFIFAVAFGHDAMAAKVAGTEISVGIVAGLAVIIFAFLLTGIYVARANTRFDQLTRDVVRRS